MKRTSFLLAIGIVALIAVIAHLGYLFWRSSSLEGEIAEASVRLEQMETQLGQISSDRSVQAVSAKKVVDKLKEESILWSEVVEDIRQTIPRNGGVPLVEILSYSGSAESAISMNVKTTNVNADPYIDVADVIESFDNSVNFMDSFVPSISAGVDASGEDVLNFLLNTTHVEEDPFAETDSLEDSLGDILNESLEEQPASGVSR